MLSLTMCNTRIYVALVILYWSVDICVNQSNISLNPVTHRPPDPCEDEMCEKAVKFMNKLKEACEKNNSNTELCTAQGSILSDRYVGFLSKSEAYEVQCNPCNENLNQTICTKEGVPKVECNPKGKSNIFQGPKLIFNKKFFWHEDEFVWKKKKRACCVTTKRTVPLMDKIDNVYPVFCPIGAGYQWIQEVRCESSDGGKKKKRKPKKCKVKTSQGKCTPDCKTRFTVQKFLVTNIRPNGWTGHCGIKWLPSWFRNVKVPTHCSSSRI